MISPSLINLAVSSCLAVLSGYRVDFDTDTGLDIYVVRDSTLCDWAQPRSEKLTLWCNRNACLEQKAAAKTEEKVVLRDEDKQRLEFLGCLDMPKVEEVVLRANSLSEKLGLETAKRPDEEIVALQTNASGLKSALALGEQITKETPEKLLVATQWKDKFAWKDKFKLIYDEEGGFYFGGTYFPIGGEDNFCNRYRMPGKPVKCVLLSPTVRGVDDADRISCKTELGTGRF